MGTNWLRVGNIAHHECRETARINMGSLWKCRAMRRRTAIFLYCATAFDYRFSCTRSVTSAEIQWSISDCKNVFVFTDDCG